MSSNVKSGLAALHVLGAASAAISSSVASNLDFGTPDDICLAGSTGTGSAYEPGDRVLLLCSAMDVTGATDKIVFTVQDADDNAGAIGTPATAVTSAVTGALTGATNGTVYAVIAVQVQSGRPWIRVKAATNGTTDTFRTHVVALGVPSNV